MEPPPGAPSNPVAPPNRVTMRFTMLRPRPVPPFFPLGGSVGLSKLLIDSSPEIGGDSRTVVAHRDVHVIASFGDRHQDFFAGRRKLDSVGEQIGDHLSEPVRIGAHFGQNGCGVEPESHAKAFGEAAAALDRVLDQWSNLHPHHVKNDFPGFDLFDIENVVDESDQALAVPESDGE